MPQRSRRQLTLPGVTTATPKGELWTIVLAAGEGTRLSRITQQLYGEPLPKQFAVIKGERSLLQETMARFEPVAPAERTVVVVPERQHQLAERQLVEWSEADVIAQPRNLGTAAGLLLPLARVSAWDSEAVVLVTPSDHEYRAPERFVARVPAALEMAAVARSGVCLFGVTAERPATDLGWIVTRQSDRAAARGAVVSRFVEKPPAEEAAELHRAGGLWNTFVMVGTARAFWQLCARHLPVHAQRFKAYAKAIGTRAEGQILAQTYRELPAADLSRDVLAHTKGLGVIAVDGAGWSDWGTPERVMESLAGTPHLGALRAQLSAGPAASARFDTEAPRAVA
jgi:mannose-1-phosphate guanylyltransferase